MPALLAMLLVLGGCSAIFGLDPPVTTDAASSDPSDATSVPPCSSTSPDLIACFDFEGAVVDQTGHLVASSVGVSYAVGKVGQAVSLLPGSTIFIGDSVVLDVSEVTMQAWVRLETQPAERMTIWDAEKQYAIFVVPDRAVVCRDVMTSIGVVEVGQWAHVACTVSADKTAIYINGISVVDSTGGMLSTIGTGAAIGSNSSGSDAFFGEIDSLRVYRTARTALQICDDGCP